MSETRVLVADDDRLVRVTVAAGLRQAGYEVLEAGDGLEALERAQETRPDLAILDVRMPGLSGLEAARRLREELGVPSVILSAYDDDEDVERAVEEGVLGYLVKPIDASQLLPTVQTAVQRAREMADLRDSEFHLNRALAQARATSVAIGILMERHRMGQDQAFQTLRAQARSSRRKVADVAAEIVHAGEVLSVSASTEQPAARRPRPEGG